MEAHPSRIRAAASLVMLRDAPGGVQLLLMRRPERDNDFRSGACVFPGGVLDAADAQARRWCHGLDDASASARLGLQCGGLDSFIAAVRESFEEVGLLYACRADGSAIHFGAHDEALHEWRGRMHRGQATLAQLCEAFNWRIDLREMAYFSHWLTPVVRPKRFDTRFFVRLAPPGQMARPDGSEALELLWLRPDEALDPARGLKLLNVTQHTLRALRGFTDARAAWQHALQRRGVTLTLPRQALARGGPRFVVNGEPAYAEIERLDPEGRGDARCELAPGDCVRLSARLWRASGVAGNAYLVADPGGGAAALIDADAGDLAQDAALRRIAGAEVRHLLCTGADPIDALRAAWPQARGHDAALLRLGTGTTLRAWPGEDGGGAEPAWLLEEEATLLGGEPDAFAPDALNARHIAWHAPRSGFLRHCGAG